MNYEAAHQGLKSRQTEERLRELYGDADEASLRYARLIDLHRDLFASGEPVSLHCAPGRAEIIGNHTDHNRGRVLAAAVKLDIAAAVTPRNDRVARVFSEGYGETAVDLNVLEPLVGEAGTSAALLRGVAAGLHARGLPFGGFDAVMTSQVLSGSGLSSSAAFEVLVCAIQDALFGGARLNAVARAEISQYAENAFFMKPSGLMDQMASSYGGLVGIDFMPDRPMVEALHFSFGEAGYAMVVVNTRSSHDDLTHAYASIPAEMRAVAAALGVHTLGEAPYARFLADFALARRAAGDRAVQRALHFYRENLRVGEAMDALRRRDLRGFFCAVNESGASSWTLLQNVHLGGAEQPMAVALARAQGVLGREGACRVHGGGFAGTTLNFVPLAMLSDFVDAMEGVFGQRCCQALDVRQAGPQTLPLS